MKVRYVFLLYSLLITGCVGPKIYNFLADAGGKNFRHAISQVEGIPIGRRSKDTVQPILDSLNADFRVLEASENRGLSFGYYQLPMGPFEFYDTKAEECFYEE